MKDTRTLIREGLRDGFPIALGYFAVAFSLGIAARNAGMNPFQGFVASLFTLASAGEYAAFTMMKESASYIGLAAMVFIANARYLLMSCALSQKFSEDMPFYHRLLIAIGITDEIFGISISRPGAVHPAYNYAAIAIAAPSWALATALGIAMGNLMPAALVSALGVALYGMFLAIIIPPARNDRVVAVLVVVAFASSFLCSILPTLSKLSSGNRTMILTVLISGVAAALFPVKEEEAMEEADAENLGTASEFGKTADIEYAERARRLGKNSNGGVARDAATVKPSDKVVGDSAAGDAAGDALKSEVDG